MTISKSTIAGLILALTLLLSAPVLKYGFVYEDHLLIEDNLDIRQFNPGGAFRSSVGYTGGFIDNKQPIAFFRPLLTIAYSINYSLFKLSPFWWHLLPLLFYLATVLFTYLLALEIIENRYWAGLAALLFAWHPVHAETVAWANCLLEPMHGTFYLAALYGFLRAQKGTKRSQVVGWWLLALPVYILALLTKETAVSLPLAAAAISFWFLRQEDRFLHRLYQAIKSAAPFFLMIFVYLFIRWLCFDGSFRITNRVPWSTVLLTLPSVLLRYTRNLLWPVDLSLSYPERYVTGIDERFIIPFVILSILALFLILAAKRERLVGFALCWMAVTLGPTLNIGLFIPEMLLQDRYLFLPLFGFALLLAAGARALFVKQNGAIPAVAIGAVLVASFYGALFVRQIGFWQDDIKLFTHAVTIDPRSPFAHLNLSRSYRLMRDYPKALYHLHKAYEVSPNYDNYSAFGDLYKEMGDYQTASFYYQKTIDNDPSGAILARNNLATIYLDLGKPEMAVELLTAALNYSPNDFLCRYNLGLALLRSGQPSRALEELEQAQRLNPEDADTIALISEARSKLLGQHSDKK